VQFQRHHLSMTHNPKLSFPNFFRGVDRYIVYTGKNGYI